MLGRTAQSSDKQSAFSSLQIPAYRALWWAGLFSFMSVQMQFLLRGILAWELTEREGALGLTYMVFGATMLVATPLGGVATDRFPKRRVLLFSQALITLAAVAMGIVVRLGIEQFWMLLLAGVAQGAAFGFYGPARVAMAADLVGRDQLGNAITLSLLSMSGTRVFAPSLAGVLAGVAAVGIGGAYLISAAFSIFSLINVMRVPNIAASAPGNRSPLTEIREGVSYVAARPELKRLVVCSFVVIMFGFNYVAFIPALVEGVFDLDDVWVGIISSASSVGAIAVSIPLARRADSAGAKTIMIAAGFLFGAGVVVLGQAPSFWYAFVAVAFIGAFTTGYQSLSNTLALGMAEKPYQGRVQSLMQLSFAGFGIAALPLGALAELIGLRIAIGVMGTVALAAMAAYAVLERPAGVSSTVEGAVSRK